MADVEKSYPGGSRKRVSRAGDAVRDKVQTAADLAVIEQWRAAHAYVLNSFQALLRGRTRNQDIVVAQRHKRRSTITGKLRRHPQMRLHRMDDVAGCRLIFRSIDELNEFRAGLHKARFKHELRNDPDQYDYIKSPKVDGYRGIHDVYKYDVNSVHGEAYKGLQIELQYRTMYQHAWATCVEVVGFVTSSNPKFKSGDERYQRIMTLASEMIARTFESCPGPLSNIDAAELLSEFYQLDVELSFLEMLRALKATNQEFKSNRTNIILIFTEGHPLEIRTYRDATEAMIDLFKLEAETLGSDRDIVFVRGNRKNVRDAFRNYFTDATDFVAYMDHAIVSLEIEVMETRTDKMILPYSSSLFGLGSE
jgi:putative GTP pyrophosphokinase